MNKVSYKKLPLLFAAFSIIYLAQSLLLPPDQATLDKYNLSTGQFAAVIITIAVPYLLIWFVALGGYMSLRSYTESIRDTKDGRAFSIISKGLLVLAAWMPISAIVNAQIDYFSRNHPDLMPTLTILNNYMNAILLFTAFYLVYKGSQNLLGTVKKNTGSVTLKLTLTYIAMSALYTFLVLQDPARYAPTESVDTASYYLPDWLIITTVVVPRLVMWFLGIQAAYNVLLYRQKVKGTIYKESLSVLAKGLGWIVAGTVALRCFQSLSTQMSELSLRAILLLIYVLLVVISIGYVLVAKGARNLKQIEEL